MSKCGGLVTNLLLCIWDSSPTVDISGQNKDFTNVRIGNLTCQNIVLLVVLVPILC